MIIYPQLATVLRRPLEPKLRPGSNIIVRLLLLEVGVLAVPLLLGSWFRWRKERVTAVLGSALRSGGFDSDPLAVDVFLDVLADRAEEKG